MQQIIIEVFDAGLFQLTFEHSVTLFLGIEKAGVHLGCQGEGIPRVAVDQSFLGDGLAGGAVIHQSCIKVCETFCDKHVDHLLDLFDVNSGGIGRVQLRQTHQTESEFFHGNVTSIFLSCSYHTGFLRLWQGFSSFNFETGTDHFLKSLSVQDMIAAFECHKKVDSREIAGALVAFDLAQSLFAVFFILHHAKVFVEHGLPFVDVQKCEIGMDRADIIKVDGFFM